MRLSHLSVFVLLIGVAVPIGIPSYAAASFYSRFNERQADDYYLVPVDDLFSELVTSEAISLREDTRFVVNLPPRRLTIYQGGIATHSYPVTIGRLRYKTPIGPRSFSKLIWNPWWYPPASDWAKNDVDTPPGPHNPLGKVKIPLGQAIVLHGTNNPRSIGRAFSHACLRMYNEDIIELATWLQNKFSKRPDDPIAERHRKRWLWRSYVVPLQRTFPLDIIYRPVELEGDELILHPDVYRYRPDLYREVTIALARIGIPSSEVDWDKLPESLPTRETVRIPIVSVLQDSDHIVAAQQ